MRRREKRPDEEEEVGLTSARGEWNSGGIPAKRGGDRGAAMLGTATARPGVVGSGSTRRPEVAKRRRPRVRGGEVVAAAGWGIRARAGVRHEAAELMVGAARLEVDGNSGKRRPEVAKQWRPRS
ncbi:hypothetical protein [Oryza sativa Japonica Group]|uniref:DUF834 domain-containing protein n=1 Tax=Oryza sativa subsp. japonica TaxID=39947 RepID=Q5JKT0_ORYSJ|nr:hypothetical protein [Oryza sativa Japonica Group]